MDGLPSCARACLGQIIPSSSCAINDLKCICLDAQLITQLGACSLQNCTIKEGLTSSKLLYTACDYPVTVDDGVYPPILTAGTTLSALAFIIRIAGRLMGGSVGVDDIVAFLALLHMIAYTAVGFLLKKAGLGTDIWLLPFPNITQILHLFFITEVLYVLCIALCKVSMLLLYLRLFPGKTVQIATKAAVAVMTAWGIAMLLANVLSCQPLSYFWHVWDGEHIGTCVNHQHLLWAHASTNILFDLVIIVLPMPTLLRLNMNWPKKIWICLMFAVGIVVTVISIIRLVSSINLNINENPTKSLVPIGIWSLLEIYLSIICACMPGMRSCIHKIYRKLYPKPPSYNYPSLSNDGRVGGSGDRATVGQQIVVFNNKTKTREQDEFILLHERSMDGFPI